MTSGKPLPWRVLRGLWRWFGIVAAVTFCATISLPTIAITGDGRLGHRLFARRWGRFTLRWCGVRLRVEGMEHVDPGRPAVIVANHASHYAFYAIGAALPVQWRAVIRREMRRIPLFGALTERAGHVFIRTGDRTQAVEDIRAGSERLGAGYWLLVFPEGRPSPEVGMLPFRKGAFRVAIDAGVPILPVAVDGRYRPGDGKTWDAAPATLILRILAPLSTEGLGPADAGALASAARAAIGDALEGAAGDAAEGDGGRFA
jgi:1-acyl-sn-glycerol-3-phosphate acyltransferase